MRREQQWRKRWGGDKGSQLASIKSLIRTVAALTTKFDNFNIPDDDDESSDKEEASPNRSNSALTRQNKKGKQKK
jgi:hypothetical protein